MVASRNAHIFILSCLLTVSRPGGGGGDYLLQMPENTNLVKRNAGPSLIPFEATNLNRLKIIHLERTGIPCSI